MAVLEDLKPGGSIRGVLPNGLVTVVSIQWFGSDAIELTYKDAAGRVGNELLYRDREADLEVVEEGRPWSFDGDGALFRLVSEAQRIHLAHLFDPVLAVHTSVVEPLPHQITAVYESMLPRQPLRFLLADDPGAGKTIMAGLLIKELIARGDLQRCLVVCPGSLAEQWQDELYRRFNLPFEILTNDKLEAARTGNWFLETNLIIARLDKLSRNEAVQEKLQAPDCRWDLVVCDEAHKMSASYWGAELKRTQRYRLGETLGQLLGLLQLQRELRGGVAIARLEVRLGLRRQLGDLGIAVLDLTRHALDQAAVLLEPHTTFFELLDCEIVLVLHLRDRICFPEKVGQLVELRPHRTEELLEDHQVLP